MSREVLIAGIGNIFLGDDGFGPEVVRHLVAGSPLPEGVRLVDYGIRGMHLAYDVLDGYSALVLIDALPGSGAPGELVSLEIGPDDVAGGEFDAHGMDPAAVLSAIPRLGGVLPPTYLVGCRPASVEEGIGLTPPVQDAVPGAADTVRALVARLVATPVAVGREG